MFVKHLYPYPIIWALAWTLTYRPVYWYDYLPTKFEASGAVILSYPFQKVWETDRLVYQPNILFERGMIKPYMHISWNWWCFHLVRIRAGIICATLFLIDWLVLKLVCKSGWLDCRGNVSTQTYNITSLENNFPCLFDQLKWQRVPVCKCHRCLYD